MTTPAALATYIDWIGTEALPAWAERGFDPAAGRFHERLDRAGTPLTVPHRAMVQARQVYVYAHAALLGWHPAAARLAETALATLLRDHVTDGADEASVRFSIDPVTGAPVSELRDAYTHAFLLFALAWMHALTGEARLLALADRLIAFVDRHLTCPDHQGLFDAHPVTDRAKRQNPVMHLLEAYLFLARTAPDRGYLDRATALVGLFRRRFFQEPDGLLLEHFAGDWSAHPNAAKRDVWEPGHHCEWVWLLAEYGRLAGEDMTPWTDRLHEAAMVHGRSPEGLLWDEVRADLVPVGRAHRIWPHTEAIKAAAVRHRAGDPAAADLAAGFAALLNTRFLGRPFAGGWTDHLAEDGRPLVDYVPASTLYHLFLAAAEGAAAFGPA